MSKYKTPFLVPAIILLILTLIQIDSHSKQPIKQEVQAKDFHHDVIKMKFWAEHAGKLGTGEKLGWSVNHIVPYFTLGYKAWT